MREQEQEPPSPAPEEDTPPACFICLSAEDEEAQGPEDRGRLQKRCRCNLYTHQNCLIRWQLQKAGQAEERRCRFCGTELGDWRTCVMDQVSPDIVSAPKAYIGVVHKGTTFKVPVTVGPNAVAEFKARIAELFAMPEGDYQVSFQCKSPVFGDSLQLSGFECFEAATHCAVVSACRRAKREEEERIAAAEAREARKLARESKGGLSRLSRLFHVPQSPKLDSSSPPTAADSSSTAGKKQGPAAALRRFGRSFAACFMPPHLSPVTVNTEALRHQQQQQQQQQQQPQQHAHAQPHAHSSLPEERSTHSSHSRHSNHSGRSSHAHRWSASFLSPLFECSKHGNNSSRGSGAHRGRAHASRSPSPFRRASVARSSSGSRVCAAPTLDTTSSSRGGTAMFDTTSRSSTLDTISSRAALESTSRVSRHSNYMYLQRDSRHTSKNSSRPLASTSACASGGATMGNAKGPSLASTSSTLPGTPLGKGSSSNSNWQLPQGGRAWGGSAQQEVVCE